MQSFDPAANEQDDSLALACRPESESWARITGTSSTALQERVVDPGRSSYRIRGLEVVKKSIFRSRVIFSLKNTHQDPF